MPDNILAALRRYRLLAILRGVPLHRVGDAARALLAGGIRLMEVSLSDRQAISGIAGLREAARDQGWIGAGTVVSGRQAREALAAGAQFLVTPHVEPEVLAVGTERAVPVICGAHTPSEIARARQLGSEIIKLFPASLGGPGYVRALLAPYPDLELLVVGGVGAENLAEFLKAGALGAGIGGKLTRMDWDHPDLEAMTRRARELVEIVTRITPGASG